jgi:hypothetical protein
MDTLDVGRKLRKAARLLKVWMLPMRRVSSTEI